MNHYQTLQVHPQASQQEIKQAYRRLAKKFHPDSQHHVSSRRQGVQGPGVSLGDSTSENLAESRGQFNISSCDKIIALNAAYEVLGNVQSRRLYDRQMQLGQVDTSFVSRQTRTAQAQQQYQRYRQAERAEDSNYQQWLREVYVPIEHLVGEILNPLEIEVDDLAADPFDYELMANFEVYLQNCSDYLAQAKQKLASRPNPSTLADVAANIYYCLERLEDGIKELEWFTFNYNDHYLHTGQEIFRIASKLRDRAKDSVQFTK